MRDRANMCPNMPLRHEFIHGDNGRGPHRIEGQVAGDPLGNAGAEERLEIVHPVLAAVTLWGFEDGGGVSTSAALSL